MKAMRMALTALALTTLATTAQAQRFGLNGAYGTDSDIGVGGRVEVDLANILSKSGPLSKAFLVGQVDFFFDCGGGICTWLDINPGLAVPAGAGDRFWVGAGLNMARITIDAGSFGTVSATETGLNIFGGLKFPLAGMSGFAEGRFALGGGEQLAISVGLMFGKKKTM